MLDLSRWRRLLPKPYSQSSDEQLERLHHQFLAFVEVCVDFMKQDRKTTSLEHRLSDNTVRKPPVTCPEPRGGRKRDRQ